MTFKSDDSLLSLNSFASQSLFLRRVCCAGLYNYMPLEMGGSAEPSDPTSFQTLCYPTNTTNKTEQQNNSSAQQPPHPLQIFPFRSAPIVLSLDDLLPHFSTKQHAAANSTSAVVPTALTKIANTESCNNPDHHISNDPSNEESTSHHNFNNHRSNNQSNSNNDERRNSNNVDNKTTGDCNG